LWETLLFLSAMMMTATKTYYVDLSAICQENIYQAAKTKDGKSG
jgi:hypothetical protein